MGNKLLKTFMMLLLPFVASAQNYNVLEEVRADLRKTANCEGPYRFEETTLTRSPKGYKPFYIGHYGRHGSRYYWESGPYIRVRDALVKAERMDNLTDRGRKLHDDFLSFVDEAIINTGDLTGRGWDEHYRIAREVAADFPEVFKGNREVHAFASVSQRAIVSMSAFCTGLGQSFPGLDISGNSLHTNMAFINPPGAPKELRAEPREVLPPPQGVTWAQYLQANLQPRPFLTGILKDPDKSGNIDSQRQLVMDLNGILGSYSGYCDSGFMDDLFSEDQLVKLWELRNYEVFCGHNLKRFAYLPTLRDIIARADEAIAGNGTAADLRFGHDVVINPLYVLLNVNGCGIVPEKPEDVKYWFQAYNTPKATTLLLVLYKKKKGDISAEDILFKALQNGKEVTLPQLTAVSGPYYKWTDLKRYVESL